MATSQTAYLNIDARTTATKDGRSTTAYITTNRQLSNGTTVDLADGTYYKKHTIASSGAPENLDFIGGGLIDANGATITWAELVLLVVSAPSGNAVNVLVGAHANPIDFGCGANTITVKPGETKVLINTGVDGAYPMTGGSSDALKLAIASGTADLEVYAVGRTV